MIAACTRGRRSPSMHEGGTILEGRPVLEGRDLVKATLPFAREKPLLSWWYFLSTTVLFAACLAAGAMPFPWWARLLASVLGGLTLCRLFIIYHDQQHGTILRGSRLADWLMTAFGI